MFNADWYQFILQNVPPPLRKSRRIAWLQVLIAPVAKAMDSMRAFRQIKLYELNHTGQVIYLEKVLNDAFDNQQRRIYITDGDFRNRIYINERGRHYTHFRFTQGSTFMQNESAQSNFKAYTSLIDFNIDEPPNSGWEYLRECLRVKRRNQYVRGIGFIINVPASLQYNSNRFSATVNFYKVAARAWKIKTF